MTAPARRARRARRPRSRRPHRAQRGVAMFVVLMLVVMVSAAGIFVAKSTSLEIRSAGYVRQAGQTHYLAESGASSAYSQLRTRCSAYFNPYIRSLAATGTLPGCLPITTSRGNVTLPCYNFVMTDFDTLFAPLTTFAPRAGSGVSVTEGSFGTGSLTPSFKVTVTELAADVTPIRGSDLSSPSLTTLPMRYEIASLGYTDSLPMTAGGYAVPAGSPAIPITDVTVRGTEALRALTVIQCN